MGQHTSLPLAPWEEAKPKPAKKKRYGNGKVEGGEMCELVLCDQFELFNIRKFHNPTLCCLYYLHFRATKAFVPGGHNRLDDPYPPKGLFARSTR